MCGISTFVELEGSPECAENRNSAQLSPIGSIDKQLEDSLEIVRHRGPDALGSWISPDGRTGLGHVRLSIVDLRPDGNQPFIDEEAGIVAVVNGELYGHEEQRESLESEYRFKGKSDCEIVIALYKHHGFSFVSHLRGEFAFVLWDSKRELLFAARDRYGIKSLYYTVHENRLLVATEMKSFLKFGWQPEWCVKTLRGHSWRFGTKTFFRGVYKILPAHYFVCQNYSSDVQHVAYWDSDYPDKRRLEERSEEEMIEGVRQRMVEAVRLRLRADVPVGVYLSGGLDSSSVAGIVANLMKSEGANLGSDTSGDLSRLHCFTVQFDKDSGADESDVAHRTANWLGADFHPVHMTEPALAAGFEDTIWHCELPFPDVNGVGKLALAEKVHSLGIKVVLTGEGADEHFGGYADFRPDVLQEPDLSWPPSHMPESKRAEEMANVGHLPFLSWANRYLSVGDPETLLAEGMDGRARDMMVNKWHPLHTSFYIWIKSYLPTFVLRYSGDNIDMAHSVEARLPFLDHHLTEYVNQLPPSLKMKYDSDSHTFNEKYILREAMKPFIPEEIYARRKKSFCGPTQYPVDGPIHKMLQRLLSKKNVDRLGFVDADVAQQYLDKAFQGHNEKAFRNSVLIAQFVVLSQRFGVKTAQAPQSQERNVGPWRSYLPCTPQ